jgi:hypothetical protein
MDGAKTKDVSFGEKIVGKKGSTPQNLSWVLVPVKKAF